MVLIYDGDFHELKYLLQSDRVQSGYYGAFRDTLGPSIFAMHIMHIAVLNFRDTCGNAEDQTEK